MSLASKLFLGGSLCLTVGTIYYVHWKMRDDRLKMKMGIVRDIQRQELRRMQKLKTLELEQESYAVEQFQNVQQASVFGETLNN